MSSNALVVYKTLDEGLADVGKKIVDMKSGVVHTAIADMGRTMIALRQVQQMERGKYGGRDGSDGLRPNGWAATCVQLGLKPATVQGWIVAACRPGTIKKTAQTGKINWQTPRNIARLVKRCMTRWSEEEQQEFRKELRV